jgi:hypothetical protein
MEFCLHAFAIPHRVAEFARRAEAWGFSGLLLATDAPSVLRPSVQKAYGRTRRDQTVWVEHRGERLLQGPC